MRLVVHWVVFLVAKNKAKAEKIIKEVADKTGFDLTTSNIQKYWKCASFFRANGHFLANEESVKDAFFNVMDKLKPIANRWLVSIPQESFEFSASTIPGEVCLPGVESICFDVCEGTYD